MSARVRGSHSFTIPSSPPEMSAKSAISIPHTDPSCPRHESISSRCPIAHM